MLVAVLKHSKYLSSVDENCERHKKSELFFIIANILVAYQEMMYFTIDEETGERIPKSTAGPYQPLTELTEDSDLSKDLAEIGDIALDYLLGNETQESQPKPDVATMPQPEQRTHDSFNDIIIQTADQPNPFSGEV